VTGACGYPMWQPTKTRPDGGCGAPATHAAPLGQTGRWLPLCGQHREDRVEAVPVSEVPER
jgi:hypothetical protein